MKLFDSYGDVSDGFKRAIRAKHRQLMSEDGHDVRQAGRLALEWANELIKSQNEFATFGIEFVSDSFGSIGNFCTSGIEFINTGELYTSNIGFDMWRGCFVWRDIGAIIERGGDRWNF